MKKRIAIVIGVWSVFLLATAIVVTTCSNQRQPTPRVSGPLSTNDVADIVQLIMRERAPLGGELAPNNALAWGWRLRERVTGKIRSITSVDGQRANVDFGDRWDSRIGYDYDLERTTNGWKVISVGWRKEARKSSQ